MKANILLKAAIVLLGLGSCKDDNAEKKLDTDILVSAEMEDKNVVIVAESEKIYECMNYQLSYSLQKNGQTYIIKFTDIYKPDICLTATGPAKARIVIGRLSHASYPLVFQLNGAQTATTLVVDTAATIQISQPGNVRLK